MPGSMGTLLLAACLAAPAAAGAAEKLVTRSGGVTAYSDGGSGPVIVAVPSLGRGCADFADVAARLMQDGFRFICPEPRGIGGSTAPGDAVTLHDLAADVAEVIRRSATLPVVVLGHAFGNTVARTVATDRPDLVRGVILLAASGRAPVSDATREAIARASDLTIPASDRLQYLARGYFASGNDATSWLDGWYPAVQATQWDAFRSSRPADYVAAGGRVPILDVQGAEDVIIPAAYSQDLHKELGDRVTVVVIPHAGHAMLPEQPAAIADAIKAWMGTVR